MQEIHQLTRDVGGLQEAVNTLKETAADHGRSLNWIKHILAVAIGAGAVIGYLFDKRFDQIMAALAELV